MLSPWGLRASGIWVWLNFRFLCCLCMSYHDKHTWPLELLLYGAQGTAASAPIPIPASGMLGLHPHQQSIFQVLRGSVTHVNKLIWVGFFYTHPSRPLPISDRSKGECNHKSQLELSQHSREGTSKREVPLQPLAGLVELVGFSRIYLINIPLSSNWPG